VAAIAMASHDTPASPALPAPAGSLGDDGPVGLVISLLWISLVCACVKAPFADRGPCSQVSLEFSDLPEIITYILNARQSNSGGVFCFQWPEGQEDTILDQIDDALTGLGEPKIRESDYDYTDEMLYVDVMGEPPVHYQVLTGLRDYIGLHLRELRVVATDAKIREPISMMHYGGSTDIYDPDKFRKQPKVQFGRDGCWESLVCEVS
jgi:hypothetical protein